MVKNEEAGKVVSEIQVSGAIASCKCRCRLVGVDLRVVVIEIGNVLCGV